MLKAGKFSLITGGFNNYLACRHFPSHSRRVPTKMASTSELDALTLTPTAIQVRWAEDPLVVVLETQFQSLPHYVPWTKAKLHLVANWLLHMSWNWIFLSRSLMFLIEIWLLHCYLIGNSLQPYIYYQLRIITTVLFLAAMRTHFVSGSAELFLQIEFIVFPHFSILNKTSERRGGLLPVV